MSTARVQMELPHPCSTGLQFLGGSCNPKPKTVLPALAAVGWSNSHDQAIWTGELRVWECVSKTVQMHVGTMFRLWGL